MVSFMRFLSFLLAVALIGCSSRSIENSHTALDTWVGADADELISEWGPPTNSHGLDSGGKVLSYSWSSTGKMTQVLSSGIAYSVPIVRSCDVLFRVDDSGAVTSSKLSGNACAISKAQCRDVYARPASGSDCY